MIEVKVRKRLRRFELNAEFKSSKKVTALFAPSGSGKSLTLQTIAGIVEPDEGKVVVNGKTYFSKEEKVNLKPQRRRVGYLFQDYALFPHMTVWENVCFGCKNREYGRQLLRTLQIEELADKKPHQLSGGQKQRVALARALAMEPELLLLDEPFSALHRSLKETLYKELKGILEEFQIPAVLVSHDIDEVFELSQWLVVMENGKTLQEGEPEELFLKPNSLKVAKILGHKNFLKAKVVKTLNGELLKVRTEGGQLLTCKSCNAKEGEEVLVSLLPFSVALTQNQETTKITLSVKELLKKRDRTVVIGEVEGEEVELHLPPSLLPNRAIEPGRKTELHLNPHLLPTVKEVS